MSRYQIIIGISTVQIFSIFSISQVHLSSSELFQFVCYCSLLNFLFFRGSSSLIFYQQMRPIHLLSLQFHDVYSHHSSYITLCIFRDSLKCTQSIQMIDRCNTVSQQIVVRVGFGASPSLQNKAMKEQYIFWDVYQFSCIFHDIIKRMNE